MENDTFKKSQGYKKTSQQVARSTVKSKEPRAVDYSSPTAMKWPLFVEALANGNADVVKQLIDEGLNVTMLRDGATPLMMAASKGNKKIAEIVIQAGVNVNAKNEDGWTALHKAAFDQADAGIVDFLLQSGVDMAAKNKAGKTALDLAGELGHHDIARSIKKHLQKLQSESQEWSAFLNSAEGRPFRLRQTHETLTKNSKFLWLSPVVMTGLGLLIGFFLNAVTVSVAIGAFTALLIDFALYFRMIGIRKYLDAVGPLPELNPFIFREKKKAGEPILSARQPSEEVPAKTLIDSAASRPLGTEKRALAVYVLAALVLALLAGGAYLNRGSIAHWYFAGKLERKGIPITTQAFLEAVSKNNEDAVGLFISAGIPLDGRNEKGQTALIIASDKGYAAMVRKLAAGNALSLNQFDKNGNTPLMTAALRGNENIAKLLLESGADINYLVPDQQGPATALQTALDVADFKEEHAKVIQYLLQMGAEVKSHANSGHPPLLLAADHGRAEAARLLIDKGADVNETDRNGYFPLLSAACKGHPELIALLVEKGADMKKAGADGRTPLMCAAREGHNAAVKTLLDRGAAVNAISAGDKTALTEATMRGHIDVAKQLLERGADPSRGYLPDSFMTFRGKSLSIRVRNSRLREVLTRLASVAAQDGYSLEVASRPDQKVSLTAKGSWNKILSELAKKNNFMLVVNGKLVAAVPYDPSTIKRGEVGS